MIVVGDGGVLSPALGRMNDAWRGDENGCHWRGVTVRAGNAAFVCASPLAALH